MFAATGFVSPYPAQRALRSGGDNFFSAENRRGEQRHDGQDLIYVHGGLGRVGLAQNVQGGGKRRTRRSLQEWRRQTA
jgi:hypothetical protein